MSDTTGRILKELEEMINEGQISAQPYLENQIRELIKKVDASKVNLFEYRKWESSNKFGTDIVEAIAKANFRQQQKFKKQ